MNLFKRKHKERNNDKESQFTIEADPSINNVNNSQSVDSPDDIFKSILQLGESYPEDMTRLCESWFTSKHYITYCRSHGIEPLEIRDNSVIYSKSKPSISLNKQYINWVPNQDLYFFVTDMAVIFSPRMYSRFLEAIEFTKDLIKAEYIKSISNTGYIPEDISDNDLMLLMPQYPYWNQNDDCIKVNFGYDESKNIFLISLAPSYSTAENFDIKLGDKYRCISGKDFIKLKQCFTHTNLMTKGKYVLQETESMGTFAIQKSFENASSPIFYV